MTYPPTPPTGPSGTWQQPYPQHGAPQQPPPRHGVPQYGPPPQSPYGAPQYGAPQPPYGASQYGPPQPFGYGGPQPYGTPQRPGGGNGKWFLIGGAFLAVVVLVAGIAIFAFTRNPDSSDASGSSSASTEDTAADAENEIRQYIEDFEANPPETFRDMAELVCSADQERVKSLPAYDKDLPLPGKAADQEPLDIIDIAVSGDTAVVRGRENNKPIELYFRNEGGTWKMCASDEPGR